MYTGPTCPLYCPAERLAPGSIMGVIEAKTGWRGNEGDAAFAMGWDVRRSFFRRTIHVGRHLLTVPMQFLGNISIVINVPRDLPPFLKAQKWARTVVVTG